MKAKNGKTSKGEGAKTAGQPPARYSLSKLKEDVAALIQKFQNDNPSKTVLGIQREPEGLYGMAEMFCRRMGYPHSRIDALDFDVIVRE